jgi:hypothetical protein
MIGGDDMIETATGFLSAPAGSRQGVIPSGGR